MDIAIVVLASPRCPYSGFTAMLLELVLNNTARPAAHLT